ncbi:hypothetical protein QBC40DRAFT_322074 [Triangularia verruculosa]|uniref:Uncharacterized protein n=1 Tax=Triangularia verruculosa TaxID=2587418 RepID=A0AAN6XKV0_9PEZI|nr:hypothetical protein QBC40DRAFT_322074 [Triangularia verruculosa]
MTPTTLTGQAPPAAFLQLSSAEHVEQDTAADIDESTATQIAEPLGGSLYSKRRTAHAKGILPPRINLRRAASYNAAEKGPLSSTSSRFSFNHLVFSPPPSPGLPSLSPPRKPPQRKLILGVRPIRFIRYSIRILSIFVVFWVSLEVLTYFFGPEIPIPAEKTRPPIPAKPIVVGPPKRSDGVEMVSQKGAPDFATPIVITDHRGKAKWTVSMPPGTPFPLSQKEYTDMCGRCKQVAARAVELRSEGSSLQQVSLSFGPEGPDHDFIDVQEAEKAGYLPKRGSGGTNTGKPVCKKSLTYVLESNEAGLGKTLMMLWISYGLAQKEGRGFFIDDTRWAYGKYSDIFEPPPIQDCSPPPNHERLPCPPQARHLVVSAANANEVFADLMPPSEEIFSPFPPSLEAQDSPLLKKQFSLARTGYKALFHLNAGDARHVDARTRKLLAKRLVPKTKGTQSGIAVGMHIRRGDRHPFEAQYRRSYLPVNTYTDFAQEIIASRFNSSGSLFHSTAEENRVAREQSFMILASDDPVVYDSDEMKDNRNGRRVVRAQDRIKLASKHELGQSKGEEKDRSVMHKFVDEAFGWEGGFYAGMFWNLGVPTANNEKKKEEVTDRAESLRLRSLVGRAYMMDLAVLADASDVVVCTVSSLGCRLLGVMMGEGVKGERWVNVDGGYGWLGLA